MTAREIHQLKRRTRRCVLTTTRTLPGIEGVAVSIIYCRFDFSQYCRRRSICIMVKLSRKFSQRSVKSGNHGTTEKGKSNIRRSSVRYSTHVDRGGRKKKLLSKVNILDLFRETPDRERGREGKRACASMCVRTYVIISDSTCEI